jgi:plastocyanin
MTLLAMTVTLLLGAENEKPASAAEVQQLRQEVARLRQVVTLMLQDQQQKNAQLLKLLESGGGVPPKFDAPAVTVPLAQSKPPAKAPKGAVSGKVNGDASDVYVFVEDLKAAPVKNQTLEIKQENKQFSPRVAVVPRGTKLVFPNLDGVFHNVFSTSAGNSFDLGTYKAGDAPKSVVMTTPGLVEVFCNLHSKMSAQVLVVPNTKYVKADKDGRFRLDGVPGGTHKLVAWTPGAKPVSAAVTVPDNGEVNAELTLNVDADRAHLNKFGQPYGSYED